MVSGKSTTGVRVSGLMIDLTEKQVHVDDGESLRFRAKMLGNCMWNAQDMPLNRGEEPLPASILLLSFSLLA